MIEGLHTTFGIPAESLLEATGPGRPQQRPNVHRRDGLSHSSRTPGTVVAVTSIVSRSRHETEKQDDLDHRRLLRRWRGHGHGVSPRRRSHLISARRRAELERVKAACGADWELCTLGDPMADLAGLLGYWHDPDDPDIGGDNETTGFEGFLSERGDGGPVRRWRCRCRSSWSTTTVGGPVGGLACIAEGVYARYLNGQQGSQDEELGSRPEYRDGRRPASRQGRRPPRL